MMREKEKVKSGGKGEVLIFSSPSFRRPKRWMSAVMALIFLFSTLCPAWARQGNTGNYGSGEMFAIGFIAGAVTDIVIALSYCIGGPVGAAAAGAGSIAANLTSLYMYYNHYETSGETVASFHVFGTEVKISRQAFWAMVAATVASILVGGLAGLAEGAAEGAGEGAAEGAGEGVGEGVAGGWEETGVGPEGVVSVEAGGAAGGASAIGATVTTQVANTVTRVIQEVITKITELIAKLLLNFIKMIIARFMEEFAVQRLGMKRLWAQVFSSIVALALSIIAGVIEKEISKEVKVSNTKDGEVTEYTGANGEKLTVQENGDVTDKTGNKYQITVAKDGRLIGEMLGRDVQAVRTDGSGEAAGYKVGDKNLNVRDDGKIVDNEGNEYKINVDRKGRYFAAETSTGTAITILNSILAVATVLTTGIGVQVILDKIFGAFLTWMWGKEGYFTVGGFWRFKSEIQERVSVPEKATSDNTRNNRIEYQDMEETPPQTTTTESLLTEIQNKIVDIRREIDEVDDSEKISQLQQSLEATLVASAALEAKKRSQEATSYAGGDSSSQPPEAQQTNTGTTPVPPEPKSPSKDTPETPDPVKPGNTLAGIVDAYRQATTKLSSYLRSKAMTGATMWGGVARDKYGRILQDLPWYEAVLGALSVYGIVAPLRAITTTALLDLLGYEYHQYGIHYLDKKKTYDEAVKLIIADAGGRIVGEAAANWDSLGSTYAGDIPYREKPKDPAYSYGMIIAGVITEQLSVAAAKIAFAKLASESDLHPTLQGLVNLGISSVVAGTADALLRQRTVYETEDAQGNKVQLTESEFKEKHPEEQNIIIEMDKGKVTVQDKEFGRLQGIYVKKTPALDLSTFATSIAGQFNNYFIQASIDSFLWPFPFRSSGFGLNAQAAWDDNMNRWIRRMEMASNGVKPLDAIAGALGSNLTTYAAVNFGNSFGHSISNQWTPEQYKTYAEFMPTNTILGKERESDKEELSSIEKIIKLKELKEEKKSLEAYCEEEADGFAIARLGEIEQEIKKSEDAILKEGVKREGKQIFQSPSQLAAFIAYVTPQVLESLKDKAKELRERIERTEKAIAMMGIAGLIPVVGAMFQVSALGSLGVAKKGYADLPDIIKGGIADKTYAYIDREQTRQPGTTLGTTTKRESSSASLKPEATAKTETALNDAQKAVNPPQVLTGLTMGQLREIEKQRESDGRYEGFDWKTPPVYGYHSQSIKDIKPDQLKTLISVSDNVVPLLTRVIAAVDLEGAGGLITDLNKAAKDMQQKGDIAGAQYDVSQIVPVYNDYIKAKAEGKPVADFTPAEQELTQRLTAMGLITLTENGLYETKENAGIVFVSKDNEFGTVLDHEEGHQRMHTNNRFKEGIAEIYKAVSPETTRLFKETLQSMGYKLDTEELVLDEFGAYMSEPTGFFNLLPSDKKQDASIRKEIVGIHNRVKDLAANLGYDIKRIDKTTTSEKEPSKPAVYDTPPTQLPKGGGDGSSPALTIPSPVATAGLKAGKDKEGRNIQVQPSVAGVHQPIELHEGIAEGPLTLRERTTRDRFGRMVETSYYDKEGDRLDKSTQHYYGPFGRELSVTEDYTQVKLPKEWPQEREQIKTVVLEPKVGFTYTQVPEYVEIKKSQKEIVYDHTYGEPNKDLERYINLINRTRGSRTSKDISNKVLSVNEEDRADNRDQFQEPFSGTVRSFEPVKSSEIKGSLLELSPEEITEAYKEWWKDKKDGEGKEVGYDPKALYSKVGAHFTKDDWKTIFAGVEGREPKDDNELKQFAIRELTPITKYVVASDPESKYLQKNNINALSHSKGELNTYVADYTPGSGTNQMRVADELYFAMQKNLKSTPREITRETTERIPVPTDDSVITGTYVTQEPKTKVEQKVENLPVVIGPNYTYDQYGYPTGEDLSQDKRIPYKGPISHTRYSEINSGPELLKGEQQVLREESANKFLEVRRNLDGTERTIQGTMQRDEYLQEKKMEEVMRRLKMVIDVPKLKQEFTSPKEPLGARMTLGTTITETKEKPKPAEASLTPEKPATVPKIAKPEEPKTPVEPPPVEKDKPVETHPDLVNMYEQENRREEAKVIDEQRIDLGKRIDKIADLVQAFSKEVDAANKNLQLMMEDSSKSPLRPKQRIDDTPPPRDMTIGPPDESLGVSTGKPIREETLDGSQVSGERQRHSYFNFIALEGTPKGTVPKGQGDN